MVEAETPIVLSLLSVAALAYFLVSLVPRVDEMEASYQKFGALTTLGIGYLTLLPLLLSIAVDGPTGDIGAVLSIAVAAFTLFGLTLVYDVFDDWIRLFADPEFNTLVEMSMVLAVLVLLTAFLVLAP